MKGVRGPASTVILLILIAVATSLPAHAQSMSSPVCMVDGLTVTCGGNVLGALPGPAPSGTFSVNAICSPTPCSTQGVGASQAPYRSHCKTTVAYVFNGGSLSGIPFTLGVQFDLSLAATPTDNVSIDVSTACGGQQLIINFSAYMAWQGHSC
jgi:hypothetical protein